METKFVFSRYPIPNSELQYSSQKPKQKWCWSLFCVNQDLNCEIVNTYNFPFDIETLPLELVLTKRK